MDGVRFESQELMDVWLIEHGFLVEHYRGQWCPIHRRQHRWCHTRTPGCAMSGGYGYDGCKTAQAEWDWQDWTWSKRVCADCGSVKWEPVWIQALSVEHHGRVICSECVKAVAT
jgi:hypothetical protein